MSRQVVCKADVSIGGGVISEIASGLTGSDVLDASGCYVIPGLVDVHTHGALGRTSATALRMICRP